MFQIQLSFEHRMWEISI